MRQRYYNPEIKRFVNQDVIRGSIANSQSLNRYSYVQGNPISYTDPFGLSPLKAMFSGTGWVHSVFGLLGCIPGQIGFTANLADTIVYAFVDHDPMMTGISLFATISCGATGIAKWAQRCSRLANTAKGVKIARTARYVATTASLISNSLNFAKNAVMVKDSWGKINEDYIKKGKALDAEGKAEVVRLGMGILGCAISGVGIAKDGITLGKMMKEDQVFSKLRDAVCKGVAKAKCYAKKVVTGQSGCFIAGTPVKTAEGDRAIEEIQTGDEVYAYDTLTGTVALKQVKDTLVHEVTELVHLTINGESIVTTAAHPFYIIGYGYKSAGELQVGEKVLLLDGQVKAIEDIWTEELVEPIKVYNLEVEDFHTYFVAELGVLVHNSYGATGESGTTSDLYSFGNKSSPRGARPMKDFGVESFDSIVGPESGPLPNGASNVLNVNDAPLNGHYHILPAGTQMPDGLDFVADGIDVVPHSPHGVGHYTIFPTREMTVNEFNELFKSLPWQYGGKK